MADAPSRTPSRGVAATITRDGDNNTNGVSVTALLSLNAAQAPDLPSDSAPRLPGFLKDLQRYILVFLCFVFCHLIYIYAHTYTLDEPSIKETMWVMTSKSMYVFMKKFRDEISGGGGDGSVESFIP